MARTVLHFVFTLSGAGCLRQALRKAGRDDPVIVAYDDLSFGPINPADPSLRAKWVENELGRSGWDDVGAATERLSDESRFPDNRKVAWLARRSAMEYAGFLDWLWRLGDASCEVVDLSEVKIGPEHGSPRPPRLAVKSWHAASRHHMPRKAVGFSRTAAGGRARTISKSLAATSIRKRATTRHRRRQTRVRAHFIFRFQGDV